MLGKYKIERIVDLENLEKQLSIQPVRDVLLGTNKGVFGLRKDYVIGKELPFRIGQTIYVWINPRKDKGIILSKNKELLYCSEEYKERLKENRFLDDLIEMFDLVEGGSLDLTEMVYL